MGRLKQNKTIEKETNLNILLNYRDNDKNKICFEICRITSIDLKKGSEKNIIDRVIKYAETQKNTYPKNEQCGRVWFLVNENKEYSEVLQVAQALDYQGIKRGYFDEIICHIKEMFGETEGKYKSFTNNIKEGTALVFYELAIDKYLEEFAPENYKEIIYEIAREYYAEASLAYFTQAKEWGFYNSGMDKRAYFNILDNVKCNQIDKQKNKI